MSSVKIVTFMLYLFLLSTGTTYIHRFICEDGTEILKTKICDGNVDCSDKSDESKELCKHIHCEKDHFRCLYGGCIKKSLRCDQKPDCLDFSDEFNCKLTHHCSSDEFLCFNTKCIHLNSTCDNINDCGDNSDENFPICNKIQCDSTKFKCKSGDCIDQTLTCDGNLDCLDGSDEFQSTCDKITSKNALCPGLISSGLNLKCFNPTKGEENCDFQQEIGTISKGECKEFYETKGNVEESKAVCQFDGRWNSEHIKCKPVCGMKENAQPLIANGYSIENWPWYVGLYSLETPEATFFCGGTLISENIVITAAHCTWRKSPNHILTVFGKKQSDLKLKEENSQQRNVSKIILHPNYYDIETNYGSDISILFMETPVIINEFIKPACIDWMRNFNKVFQENITGTVVGLGLTENNTFSTHLQATEIPIVTTEECIKNQKRDFHKYITFTSFCAGWMNGTGVCNGDSGGGLLIQNEERWYLEGIVSISPRKNGKAVCDTKKLTIFTKLSMYLDWIKNVVPSTMLGL